MNQMWSDSIAKTLLQEMWHFVCDPAGHMPPVHTISRMPQIKNNLPTLLKTFCKSPQRKKESSGEEIFFPVELLPSSYTELLPSALL